MSVLVYQNRDDGEDVYFYTYHYASLFPKGSHWPLRAQRTEGSNATQRSVRPVTTVPLAHAPNSLGFGTLSAAGTILTARVQLHSEQAESGENRAELLQQGCKPGASRTAPNRVADGHQRGGTRAGEGEATTAAGSKAVVLLGCVNQLLCQSLFGVHVLRHDCGGVWDIRAGI